MTIESVTYISDLNATYPAAGDLKSEGDDHIRNIKTGIKTTFPNVSGAVTPTHTEFNYVVGVTSAIQTQINAKAPAASPVFTGQMTNALGAVGAPSYSFTGDTNNGWWSPGADIQAWSTAGSERLRLAANGQLLNSSNTTWGTNNTAYTMSLQGGDASSGAFAANGAAIVLRGTTTGFNNNGIEMYAGGVEAARVDSSGRLLIDTTTAGIAANAAAYLTVGGAHGTALISVKGSGTQEALVGADASGVFGGSYSNHDYTIRTNNAARVTVTTDGRVYGSALHNNAGAVTGTTNQYIASGTYTPTVSTTTNVSASAIVGTFKWMRVGNVVHVAGQLNVTPTAAAPTQTTYSLSLPIASTLAAGSDLSGTTVSISTTLQMTGIVQAASNLAGVTMVATTTGINRHSVVFSYEVL